MARKLRRLQKVTDEPGGDMYCTHRCGLVESGWKTSAPLQLWNSTTYQISGQLDRRGGLDVFFLVIYRIQPSYWRMQRNSKFLTRTFNPFLPVSNSLTQDLHKDVCWANVTHGCELKSYKFYLSTRSVSGPVCCNLQRWNRERNKNNKQTALLLFSEDFYYIKWQLENLALGFYMNNR